MSEQQPRENPSGADNEQGSPTEAELAWIAGHFDGDGWIGLMRARRTNSRHLRYTAAVMVVTTSDRIATEVARVFDALQLKHSPQFIAPHVGSDGSPRRAKWNLAIRSNTGTKRFLTAIRPYLIEKGHCADLVLDYIEWREAQPTRPGGAKTNQPLIVGMKECAEETMRLLREDRNRSDPSTTTRLAPASVG